jgi:hypothetical protein
MFLAVGYGVGVTISSAFACVPVAAFWDVSIKGAHCTSKKFNWFFNASVNIFTDLFLLAIPMPVLYKLHLPFKQKMLLICAFALGGL